MVLSSCELYRMLVINVCTVILLCIILFFFPPNMLFFHQFCVNWIFFFFYVGCYAEYSAVDEILFIERDFCPLLLVFLIQLPCLYKYLADVELDYLLLPFST